MALNIRSGDDVAPAFLKMGLQGEAGTGKSKTASKVAIGLVKRMQEMGIEAASKPVGFFDTEDGVGFIAPDFKEAGIELRIVSSKAFADMIEFMRWAEANCSVLIIDSISHPYRELQASYLKKKQRSFLQMDDWNFIKGPHGWAQFSELYVNSKLHVIICGREGNQFEQYTDENGKRQLEKVGVKMKTETETAFEPSLLVHMEKQTDQRTLAATHLAIVLKDRADKINGAELVNPVFESFLPHIATLRLGGAHSGVAPGDSSHMIKTEKRDWQPVQREIVCDEIKTLLEIEAGGMGAEDKKRRLKLLLQHFDATWTEIEKVMPLVDLRRGYDSLHRELKGTPSKYADAPVEAMNDSLPEHSAPPAAAVEAPKVEVSVEQKWLDDLKNIETLEACAHWGMEFSKLDGLDPDARLRVCNAFMQRQTELRAGPKAEKAAEPAAEVKPGKPKPEPKAKRQLETAEDYQRATADLAQAIGG